MDGVQFSPWQQMRLSAMAMQQARAQQQARQQAGGVLYNMMGGTQQQAPQMPPAMPMSPPQAAPAPGSMSPGGGNPAMMPQNPQPPGGMRMTGQGGIPNLAQQAGMQQQPPMRTPPPTPQPFKAMPTAGQAPSGPTSISAPPAAATAAPQEPQQRPFNLRSIVGALKAAGVPPERALDMMDALSPAMNAENKQELESFRVQNAALTAANRAYAAVISAGASAQLADTGAHAERRRRDQGQQNIDIKRDKENRLRQQASAAAGGGGGLKTTELIYPKDASGKIDTSQPPIGVRAVTKTGRIINLDAEGHQTPTLAGGTAKEAKASTVNVRDTVRGNLVEGSALNAINRLDEIEKLHPKGTVSVLFGKSADGIASSIGHAAVRTNQSKGQQDIDAKWASFIDEAIPVFTGGLRGSDAFRRFLIEQAPQPGSKPEVIAEKMRLFRENIRGTQKAFANKFKEDPAMWGPGVTKDQVGGKGVPRGTGLPEGMPEGSKVVGKTPAGKDVYQAPDGTRYTAD